MRRTVPGWLPTLLAVLVVALVAAASVLAWQRLGNRHSGARQLTAAENAAVSAARQESINIQTYRRASFDADFQAALDGLTTPKRTQWQANKAALMSQLTGQKIDTAATVAGAGLVSFTKDSAVVVVASDSQKVDSTGKTTTIARNRFQITMKLVGGKWLMDDLASVSVS